VSKATILIVEDEPEIAELIRFHVDREGFEPRVVHSGQIALERVHEDPPSLILLDLMLPDVDGLEVCRRLKWENQTRDIPVLIVSAKGDETDIVSGIELGADDYITKPFSPKVLMARVKNVLRRYKTRPSRPEEPRHQVTLASGDLVIDSDRHTVTAEGRPIDLTVTEFGILHYLASRPGFVRTRDQIISAVHGNSAVLSSRTVDVHVTALRRKLGDLGRIIATVRGVGYRLVDTAEEPVT
jgi:two-component system phosphate regulon response regulator PhoB